MLGQKLALGIILGATLSSSFHSNVSLATSNISKIGDEINRVKKIRLEAKEFTRLSQNSSTSSAKLNQLRYSLQKAGIDTKNLQSSMKKLNVELDTLRKREKIRLNIDQSKGAMDEAKEGMIGHIATLGTIAVPIKIAMDYEQKLTGLKVFAGATADEFKMLDKEALRLGAVTSFSASQAAEAMTNFAKNGMSAKQIITATGPVMGMAAIESMDLAEAAMIAGDTMNGFQLGADQMGRVADVMAAASNASSISIRDLGETMSYAASSANTVGVSLEEVSGMAALLGNVGIKGSSAGTALSASLMRLSAPTTSAQEALDDLKVNPLDKDGNLRNIIDIMGDLGKATANMGNAEKLGKLSTIFGMEAARSISAMLGQGEDKIRGYVNIVGNSTGFAERQAAAMCDTTKMAFDSLKGSLETLSIQATRGLLPVIKGVTNGLIGVTNTITYFTEKAPGVSTALIVGISGFSGLMLAVKATSFVVNFFKMQWGTLKDTFVWLRGKIIPAISSMKSFTSSVISYSKQAALSAWTATKRLSLSVWNFGKQAVASAVSGIKSLATSMWSMAKKAVVAMISGIKSASLSLWSFAKRAVISAISGIGSLMASMWAYATTAIPAAISATWGFTTALLANPITWVVAGIVALGVGLYLLVKHWDKVTKAFSVGWGFIKNIFSRGWNLVSSIFSNGVNRVKSIFSGLPGPLKKIAMAIGTALIVSNPLGWLVGAVILGAKLFGKLKKLGGGNIWQGFKTGISMIWNWGNNAISRITGLFSSGIEKVKSIFSGLPGPVKSAMKLIRSVLMIGNPISMLLDGIRAGGKFVAKMKATFGSMNPVVWIQGGFNKLKNWIGSFSLVSSIKSILQGAGNAFLSFYPVSMISYGFTAIKTWLSGFSLANVVRNILNSVMSVFNGFSLIDSGRKLLNTFVEGIKSAAGAVFESVKGVFTKVRDLLPFSNAKTGPFSRLTDSGRAVLSTISQGIQSAKSMPGKAISTAFTAAIPMVASIAPAPIENTIIKELNNSVPAISQTISQPINQVISSPVNQIGQRIQSTDNAISKPSKIIVPQIVNSLPLPKPIKSAIDIPELSSSILNTTDQSVTNVANSENTTNTNNSENKYNNVSSISETYNHETSSNSTNSTSTTQNETKSESSSAFTPNIVINIQVQTESLQSLDWIEKAIPEIKKKLAPELAQYINELQRTNKRRSLIDDAEVGWL